MKQVWVNAATCSLDPGGNAGRGVADGGHGDAGAHVDQRVPVHVEQDPATGGSDEHGQQAAHPAGDRGRTPRLQLQ
jgi:hypothetical protein